VNSSLWNIYVGNGITKTKVGVNFEKKEGVVNVGGKEYNGGV